MFSLTTTQVYFRGTDLLNSRYFTTYNVLFIWWTVPTQEMFPGPNLRFTSIFPVNKVGN